MGRDGFPTAWIESELQPKLWLPVEGLSLDLWDTHSHRRWDCGIPELPDGNEAPKCLFLVWCLAPLLNEVVPLSLWGTMGTEIFPSQAVCGTWNLPPGGLEKG